MLSFILWYLTLTLLGWITFPLSFRLFSGMAERGYVFSRILGLLLWGYLFWLLTSLGVLRNDAGGVLFALLLVTCLSGWALLSGDSAGVPVAEKARSRLNEIGEWLRARRSFVLTVEVLFLLAFGGYALVRAANPEIFGTEKPMEVAFINAILRSPTFPPHDPWLSGFAISYYYFGYTLVAMLAQLTGVPGAVAFNLGLTLIFGLGMLGAYGIVFDLLGARGEHRLRGEQQSRELNTTDLKQNTIYALFGPLFILLVSNIEGLLEVLHARGLLPGAFWMWLDIQDINQPPEMPFEWLPRNFGTGSWWWWRASRVLQDYDFLGNSKEIIDEFPVFSFLLGDLHPHVLVIPFAFLAMAISLNLLLSGGRRPIDWFRRELGYRESAWIAVIMIFAGSTLLWLGLGNLKLSIALLGLLVFIGGGVLFAGIPGPLRRKGVKLFVEPDSGGRVIGFSLHLDPVELLFGAVILGGLAFLNTWDFPFYVILFAGAYTLRRIWNKEIGSYQVVLRDFFGLAIVVGILGFFLYLPFYLGFSSQAGGIIPNLIYPTRGAHLWVMFITLFFPIAIFLFYLLKLSGDASSLQRGLGLVFGIALALWLLSLLFALGILAFPGLRELFMGSLAAPSPAEVFQEALLRRIVNPGAWLTLTVLLGFTIALLWPRRQNEESVLGFSPALYPAHLYSLALTLLASLLVFGPEFFFIRDQFGWRINTIFKFYYQAWLMWGVVAAYATVVLLRQLSGMGRVVFRVTIIIILGFGMVYTVLGLWDKTQGFDPPSGLTLDGSAYLESQSPDEMAAIHWLLAAPPGVVSEAVGGSFTGYARVSAFSGQPAVLGWPGHESQWRGGGEELGSRESDIQRLYCGRDWEETQAIIDQYNIRYIYVGNLERTKYSLEVCGSGLNEEKFSRYLRPVFQQGDVSIYETPGD